MRAASIAALSLAGLVTAGCGSALNLNLSNNVFSVSTSADHLSTSQTVRLKAEATEGGAAAVHWVTPDSGRIDESGVYTPPAFLDRDSLHVQLEAQLASDASIAATVGVDVYPAISIAPENVALTAGSVTTLYATIAETGGGAVSWTVAKTPGGAPLPPEYGRFSQPHCHVSTDSFTQCTVVYTAPASLPYPAGLLYARAALRANPSSYTAARVLLNNAADATPLDNEALQVGGGAALGASGGNANDSAGEYCCGGTLGALVRIGGQDYVLSNNHVLARSDEAAIGEAITQPGLTDTQCGMDPSNSVATLSYAPKLHSSATNVDAAIARVEAGNVRGDGGILSLGAAGANRALLSAPPASDIEDITQPGHALPVLAKSGRSTGLTCAPISEIAMDLKVDFNTACDGSGNGFTKIFRNQIAISGAAFSDTGDSGSLLVDQQTAQPVGMMFAGNAAETFANPIADVLDSLAPYARQKGADSVTIAGGPHHEVTCLDYDAAGSTAGMPSPLSGVPRSAVDAAIVIKERLAPQLLEDTAVFGVGVGSDPGRPGRPAIIVLVSSGQQPASAPAEFSGLRVIYRTTDAPRAFHWKQQEPPAPRLCKR